MAYYDNVRAKKALGQHFLRDEDIARRIALSLKLATNPSDPEAKSDVLEVGPGTGVLTKYLLEDERLRVFAVEIDRESVSYLTTHYPQLTPRLIEGDFLEMETFPDLYDVPEQFYLIGNFPYNISSQIFFKVLEWRERIPQIVGMVQKEVAMRLAAPAGSKTYGILSVLLQAWYDIDYLFTVPPGSFIPPPKVQSAVIRLRRNKRTAMSCDPAWFKKVVKTAFNQRRKTLRNALKPLQINFPDHPYMDLRAEQLSIAMFEEFATLLENNALKNN